MRPSRPTDHPGPRHTGAPCRVLCVGAATVDRSFRSLDPIRPGTSNPGASTKGFGGVARNVAENLARRLKEWGIGGVRVEGLTQGDWVLIDAGDVIVHLFREEVRSYYDLEGMWSVGEKGKKSPKPERVGSAA